MIRKNNTQIDSSKGSDYFLNNNSTFITNSNGSIKAQKNIFLSQNKNLKQIENHQQRSLQNHGLKVRIQTTDMNTKNKIKIGNNFLSTRESKKDYSPSNKLNVQMKQKKLPYLLKQNYNSKNKKDQANLHVQINNQLSQSNGRITHRFSGLKQSNSEKTIKKPDNYEQSQVFFKSRRMATIQQKREQKIYYLKDTFQKMQELYDAEKYRKQNTNTVLKDELIQTATRILDSQSSGSSDQLSQYEQKHRQKQATTDQEIVEPQSSVFFKHLRNGNLQAVLQQQHQQNNKQKMKYKKVNLNQLRVQYSPLTQKDHPLPIELHTFDEIQNTLSGKSKKFLINNYKSEKLGLQMKVNTQADNFMDQISQAYSKYYKQKELDQSSYSKEAESTMTKISTMNKIGTLNQLNDNYMDQDQERKKKKLGGNYNNFHYKRNQITISDISEIDDIHIQDIPIVESKANLVSNQNKKQKNKKEENKLLKLINIYQKRETEGEKQPEVQQFINLKRNKLEGTWPHKEQNQGDNSFHSFTEAQLDTYYNHSQSIQKNIIDDPNIQKSIKNLLKLEYFFNKTNKLAKNKIGTSRR
ncbi:hypothetical protein TTHERM_00691560 (macronuclear) [Tetrahymena thermophila SB210]|uniref:Uncharacterized protein n=1 Tax=Tetrahymena thermophila (strain SB210) TaxID=312017 RepID=I7LZP2_TETTS|nr:hypothetical protein TTHERM_00691560 [Tetrahymena thermophila SB210]EAR84458.2 hypothetical protein TTHERM_00691560 [Tetrahymena thermophila SB210]|eukprot:XP_001032121.2 hypothetical protein TTHERM_00691560 [Tetrahymena thermophila SB210]